MTVELDVVIPVRDVDDYLTEAVASALDQGAEVAVAVVDAGSRRPVALAPEHAADPRVRLVRSEQPLTAGAARNLGVVGASAPWLSFLDADDVWPSGSRRALIDAALAAGRAGAAGTVVHFGEPGRSDGLVVPEGTRPAHLAGGIVVSRGLWERVGAFHPALRTGEFVDWVARARDEFVDIPDVVLRRRVHRGSTTVTSSADRSEYLEVVRRWMTRTDS